MPGFVILMHLIVSLLAWSVWKLNHLGKTYVNGFQLLGSFWVKPKWDHLHWGSRNNTNQFQTHGKQLHRWRHPWTYRIVTAFGQDLLMLSSTGYGGYKWWYLVRCESCCFGLCLLLWQILWIFPLQKRWIWFSLLTAPSCNVVWRQLDIDLLVVSLIPFHSHSTHKRWATYTTTVLPFKSINLIAGSDTQCTWRVLSQWHNIVYCHVLLYHCIRLFEGYYWIIIIPM